MHVHDVNIKATHSNDQDNSLDSLQPTLCTVEGPGLVPLLRGAPPAAGEGGAVHRSQLGQLLAPELACGSCKEGGGAGKGSLSAQEHQTIADLCTATVAA